MTYNCVSSRNVSQSGQNTAGNTPDGSARTFAHIPSHVPGATSRTAMHSIGIRYHGFGVSSGCNGLMWCHQTIAAVREPCATADAVDATYAN